MKHQAYENADVVMTYFAYVIMFILFLGLLAFVMGIIMLLNELR